METLLMISKENMEKIRKVVGHGVREICATTDFRLGDYVIPEGSIPVARFKDGCYAVITVRIPKIIGAVVTMDADLYSPDGHLDSVKYALATDRIRMQAYRPVVSAGSTDLTRRDYIVNIMESMKREVTRTVSVEKTFYIAEDGEEFETAEERDAHDNMAHRRMEAEASLYAMENCSNAGAGGRISMDTVLFHSGIDPEGNVMKWYRPSNVKEVKAIMLIYMPHIYGYRQMTQEFDLDAVADAGGKVHALKHHELENPEYYTGKWMCLISRRNGPAPAAGDSGADLFFMRDIILQLEKWAGQFGISMADYLAGKVSWT